MAIHSNTASLPEMLPTPAVPHIDTAQATPVEKTPPLFKADPINTPLQDAGTEQTNDEEIVVPAGPRTVGEKLFDKSTYERWGLWFTLAASVAIAMLAKHGESKVPFTKHSFKDHWTNLVEKFAANPGVSRFSETSFGKLLCGRLPSNEANAKGMAETALMTTALMMGGNLAIIPIKAREARKKELVRKFNEKYGDAMDVAQGNANIDAEPKQNWTSLILGRLVAWSTVFLSLTAASVAIRKGATVLEARGNGPFTAAREKGLDAFSNWVGKRVGRLMGHNAAARKWWKNMGKILALDVFATVAAENILKFGSRAISRARHTPEESSALIVHPKPVHGTAPDVEYISAQTVASQPAMGAHQARILAENPSETAALSY